MKSRLPILAAALLVVVCVLAVLIAVLHPDADRALAALGADAPHVVGLGLIVNQASLDAAFRGFKVLFNAAFAGGPSQYQDVAMVVPSNTKKETYAWLGSITRFREWLGDRVIQNLSVHDYTIRNKSFENTVGVDRDDIEDDTIGVYAPIFSQLGLDAKTHPDELVFALLAAGFTTTCYDGQYFFDTDHPVLDAAGNPQSVSNHGGGASTPWFLLSTKRMLKPLIFQKRREYQLVAMDDAKDENVFSRKEYRYGVDARCNVGYGLWQLAFGSKVTLDATGYAAARSAMMSFRGDNAKPLGIIPDLLVVPPSLEGAGLTLLQAEKNANGADNIYRNTARLLVCPWLA